MSYHVVRWVLSRSPVTVASERFVLVVLAEHASHDGYDARPSKETIARETGYSERQVQRALAALQAAGAIEQTGVHESGVRIWRVVMDRDDFNAANWDAGADADFYRRRRGGDTASPRTQRPRGGDTASPESPEPSKAMKDQLEMGDSDGWGDTASPPRRRDVAPRIAAGFEQAKRSLVDDARNGAAAAIFVEPLALVSGDERRVVLATSPASLDRTRADWTGAIVDALQEATGLRPAVEIVAPETPPDSELARWLDLTSGATRTLPGDEESTPASTGRPDAGAGSSLNAPPEEEP